MLDYAGHQRLNRCQMSIYCIVPYRRTTTGRSDVDCVINFRYRGTVIGNRYGPGTGVILLDDVDCVGHETSITDCGHRGWSNHNCDHTKDVSVSCGTSPVHYGNFSINTLD